MKHTVVVKLVTFSFIVLVGCLGFINIVNVASESNNIELRGTRNGKDWSEPVQIAKYDYTYVPSPISIVVDKTGDWHIVYSDRILYENNSQRYFIRYKNPNSTKVLAEAFGNIFNDTGFGLGFPTIALDKAGGLHVVYTQWSNDDYFNQSIMYLKKGTNSSSWSKAQEIAKFDYIWIPSRSSIAIDSKGDWHIVYSDRDRYEDGSDKRYIKYKNKASTETLAEGKGDIFQEIGKGVGHPSIGIDASDTVYNTYIYLDYTDVSDQDIMYRTKKASSQSWSTAKKITTFDYSFKPSYSSIAVDSEGDWHIVYPDLVSINDNTDRRYVKYKNVGSTETLAEGAGDIFGGTGEGVGYPSIAIGLKGNLHVVYTHMNYKEGTNQTIMYTTRTAPDISSQGSDSDDEKDSGFIPGFESNLVLICVLLITIKFISRRYVL